MQAPSQMSPQEFRQQTGLDLAGYVKGQKDGVLEMDLHKLNQDLNKGAISCEDWLCKNIPELDEARKFIRDLKAQVQKVRELRSTLESKTQEHHELLCDFNRLHKDLIEAMLKAKNDLPHEEAQLRKLTLEVYAATGNKKPVEGMGVRITKGLQYDANSIKQWAIKEGHLMFLTLDCEGFEGWAKAMLKSGHLPASLAENGAAVREIETPQATIGKVL